MDKDDVIDIHSGILLNHKKDEILPFPTTWGDPEGIILCEINQTEIVHDFTMWNLKNP